MEDLRLRDPTLHRFPPPRLGVCGEENTRRHQWVQVKNGFMNFFHTNFWCLTSDCKTKFVYKQKLTRHGILLRGLLLTQTLIVLMINDDLFQIQVCLAWDHREGVHVRHALEVEGSGAERPGSSYAKQRPSGMVTERIVFKFPKKCLLGGWIGYSGSLRGTLFNEHLNEGGGKHSKY